jgi:hypothetical protein
LQEDFVGSKVVTDQKCCRQRKQEEEKGRVHCSRSRSRTVQEILSKVFSVFVPFFPACTAAFLCRLDVLVRFSGWYRWFSLEV